MIIGDKYVKRYFLFALLLFVLFITIWKVVPLINTPEKLAKNLQNDFVKYESSFEKLSDVIIQAMEIDSLLSWDNIDYLIGGAGNSSVYIFKYDSLFYWNNNELNPEDITGLPLQKTGIYHFKSGWFIVANIKKNDWNTILYKRITKEYPFKNDYLVSTVDKELIGDNNVLFNTKNFSKGIVIKNKAGVPVASLDYSRFNPFNHFTLALLFFIYIVCFLFLVLLVIRLHNLLLVNTINVLLRLLFVLIDVLLVFVVVANYITPGILHQSFWFEKWHTLFPFADSRGAVVMLTTALIAIAINFYRNTKHYGFNNESRVLNVLLVSLFNFIILFLLLYLFKSFYEFTFKPNDHATGFLFRRDFIELYFISGIAIAVFFFQQAFISLLQLKKEVLMYYISFTLIYTLCSFLLFNLAPLFYVSVLFIQFLSLVIIHFTTTDYNLVFLRYLLLTVMLALGFSVIINDSYSAIKNRMQKETVKYLKINRDYFLEGKFYILRNKLHQDSVFKGMLENDYSDDRLIDYLFENYFDKSFKSYDIQLTVCKDGDLLEIQPQARRVNCKDYFIALTHNKGVVVIDTSLVLMNEVGESRYYLGNLNLKADSSGVTTLFVEMYSSVVPTGLGYPELLIDKSNQLDLTGYSIAKFHQNVLVYKMGEYDYHSSYSFMQQYPNNRFYFLNNYLHYKIRINGSDILIVSRPVRGFSEQLATFSFMFLLFSLLAVIIWFSVSGRKQLSLFNYSFRARLQVFIIASLLLLFVLMSVITIFYFDDIRQTFIINQLNEKTKSVLIELQDKFTRSDFITDTDQLYLRDELQKFSMIFFTDINIYKRSGILKASSRPRVFESGLLSTLINSQSYRQIMIDKKLFYLTKENIGKLTYYSAYVPLNVDAGEPAGILNLPYFARENEVKKSFLPMLFNFLNIFVIIGILGTFIALIISRILTRPLAMLKQSLSEISIDKKNEPIVWKNNDEIGLLIAEYNKMVEKLEESARLLKQSERETAWREVAQQVAHEIRNPLTPMKLNIQYLQKIYNEPGSNFDKKWKSVSDSLIDQIEALNEVASTFFDLASSGSTQQTQIDIIQLIRSVIDLYHNHKQINLLLDTDLERAFVAGRQNELLRVFNNLIKNAVQSIGDNGGEVTISVKEIGNWYEIKISDTGKGISDDLKEKVFQPYFTTKSGGTGIGLAIVKNIVTETGGEISFSSEENKGTVFIIRLPRFNGK